MSQNILLRKYGLEPHDEKFRDQVEKSDSKNLVSLRQRLTGIEGKYTQKYYWEIFNLLPEKIRPEKREGFMAYDGVNNLFNLGYEVLGWKVHKALVKAKLEPYLGFLHSNQMGKMSLVCDFQEIYRYLIDDFLIKYCKRIGRKDFVTKIEVINKRRRGKKRVSQ